MIDRINIELVRGTLVELSTRGEFSAGQRQMFAGLAVLLGDDGEALRRLMTHDELIAQFEDFSRQVLDRAAKRVDQ